MTVIQICCTFYQWLLLFFSLCVHLVWNFLHAANFSLSRIYLFVLSVRSCYMAVYLVPLLCSHTIHTYFMCISSCFICSAFQSTATFCVVVVVIHELSINHLFCLLFGICCNSIPLMWINLLYAHCAIGWKSNTMN